jgi:hypothetical protein
MLASDVIITLYKNDLSISKLEFENRVAFIYKAMFIQI